MGFFKMTMVTLAASATVGAVIQGGVEVVRFGMEKYKERKQPAENKWAAGGPGARPRAA